MVICTVQFMLLKDSATSLVSLFNGISTLFRLFNAKAILLEEQYWYYLTHSWEDKGVHTFPKGIFPKVNVIARLEYELAYYDSAVYRFNHYTKRTPPSATSGVMHKYFSHKIDVGLFTLFQLDNSWSQIKKEKTFLKLVMIDYI